MKDDKPEPSPSTQPPTEQIETPATVAIPEARPKEEVGEEISPDEADADVVPSAAELRKQMEAEKDVAVEITGKIPVGRPDSKNEYSIKGIEKLEPKMGRGVRNQAIGAHAGRSGRLNLGAQLSSAEGFRVRESERAFGADIMLYMLKSASKRVNKTGNLVTVASISQKGGGRLCRGGHCHASHRTGLDVDVILPSTNAQQGREMWNACPTVKVVKSYVNKKGKRVGRSFTICKPGGRVSERFDTRRFYNFVSAMACAKPKNGQDEPVIAMFLDREIKRHMCGWVRSNVKNSSSPSSCGYKTLRKLIHAPGHFNHVHIRLACPGNEDCIPSEVSPPKGNGC